MALLTWRDSYSVKVPSLDDQHQRLVGLINALHDAMTSGEGKAKLGDVLRELVTYTRVHFSFEEQQMARAFYPELKAHREQHRALIEQVGALVARLDEGSSVVIETLAFLRAWIVEHIQQQDMAYSDCLVGKGLK